jgi:hypothetical protein
MAYDVDFLLCRAIACIALQRDAGFGALEIFFFAFGYSEYPLQMRG